MKTKLIEEKLSMAKSVLSTALGGLESVLTPRKNDISSQGDECVHRLRFVLPILTDNTLRSIVENTTVEKLSTQESRTRSRISQGLPVTRHQRNVARNYKNLVALVRYHKAVTAIRDVLLIFKIGPQSGRYSQRLLKAWRSFLTDCFSASVEDKLEIGLKKDFQVLLALGCAKPVEKVFYLFKGFLLRVILQKCANMNRGNVRSASFLRTLYESKRCWEALSPAYANAQRQKHRELLTSAASSSRDGLKWIKRAVDILVPFGTKFKPASCIPTFSASMNTTKDRGGNHSEVGLGVELPLAQLGLFDTYSLEQEKKCFEMALLDPANNIVEYQTLPEPGKFRVITKGPSPAYTGVRRLQGFLLNRWKKLPCSTMTEDFEQRLHKEMAREPKRRYLIDPYSSGVSFCSGDYSDATDAIHRDATRAAVRRIMTNMIWPKAYMPKAPEGFEGDFEDYYFSLIDNAVSSIEEVSVKYSKKGEPVTTTRGQLMGHPLSFPLLCVINLSTYMRTINEWRYDRIFADPFFINGDDILFKGTSVDYHDWRLNSGEVGLCVNEVKTYFHKKYYLINSLLGKGGETVEYINLALALGHRVKGEPQRLLLSSASIFDTLSNYSVGANKCCRYFVNSLKKRLPKLVFRGRPFYPNFFVQKDLGGLGMQSKKPFRITGDQRKVASYLWRNPEIRPSTEKLGKAPTSCLMGLKKFQKIRPAVERILWQGPLLREDDPDTYTEAYLGLCNKSTAWVRNSEEYDPEYYRFTMGLKKAQTWNGRLLAKSKIKDGIGSRMKILGSCDRPYFWA